MAQGPFMLLQSRDRCDLMCDHEVQCFRATMDLAPEEIVVFNVVDGLPTRDDLRGVAGLLMGGSGDYGCLDGHRWIERLIDFVRDEVVPSGRPMFAACFGFQVLVRALGGEMIQDPDNIEIGTFELALTPEGRRDPLFALLPDRFMAQVGHKDRAARLPPGTVNLSASTLCPLHALRVVDRPIWATQFHPELDLEAVSMRYRTYQEKYAAGGSALPDDPFFRSLQPSPHTGRLLAEFAHGVREGRFGAPASVAA